jgi:hypothetical protein
VPDDEITASIKHVSMLSGLFWEVSVRRFTNRMSRLGGIADYRGMRERARDVAREIKAFEEQFEAVARQE